MHPTPLFLSEEAVLSVHATQIRVFGGASGILDENLLKSAVVHPQNLHHYRPECTLFEIAAAYAFHICKNHPFRDGNKRTSIACAIAFLDANGWLVMRDLTEETLALAEGQITELQFADALAHSSKRKLTKFIADLLARRPKKFPRRSR